MNKRIFFYSFLAVVLAVAVYFHNNTAGVYAKIGNYYYRHNKIDSAQKCYEKSFELGNKDSSVRDIYVNSIINFPLTVESQEKLIAIAEDKIQDGASVKAKYFLSDLKREIHRQYPENYIKQAPFNQKIVRWSRFPITYTFKNPENIFEEYIDEINKAFSEWEKAGSVMFAEGDKDADIVISFSKACSSSATGMEYGRKYVIAYTMPLINSSTLQKMNIVFCTQDPDGKKFTRNQIYNTALHEIFHALGFMGHSFNSENIMYLAKDNSAYSGNIRTSLTDADKTTLKLLYKIKPDITNTGELKSEYIPYLILGDDEEVNSSKAKEAKNYIYHAPTLPGGYIDLAESLAAQKRYPEAIRNLEKALNLADTDEIRYIVYYNLAVAYYYMAHKEMVLGYIDKAAAIKDTAELHFLKAETLLDTDREGAVREYNYLMEIDPVNPDYAIRLANLYIKERNYLKARSVLKKYINKNPEAKNDKRFSPYRVLLF